MSILIKLSDDKFDGNHPNNINKGYEKSINAKPNEVEVGKPYVFGSFITTEVQEIVSSNNEETVFKTSNSTYKVSKMRLAKYITIVRESRTSMSMEASTHVLQANIVEDLKDKNFFTEFEATEIATGLTSALASRPFMEIKAEESYDGFIKHFVSKTMDMQKDIKKVLDEAEKKEGQDNVLDLSNSIIKQRKRKL